MNPALIEPHATDHRSQLQADVEHRRLARQARTQRSTRATKADTLTTLVSRLSLGRKGRVVEARAV